MGPTHMHTIVIELHAQLKDLQQEGRVPASWPQRSAKETHYAQTLSGTAERQEKEMKYK